ncbi:MAG: restriction endonuclease subunit S [Oscillospiraceae bacterium]|jgi:type I restriction enzyme S subunit|nr:restriction endonuclease subunit S [Oscillospiraceae bacterium]
MSELLTGKKRLPGFEGEWVEEKLGEMLKSIPIKPYQILQQDIISRGSYPVVSQSDNFIEGYSEEKTKLFHNVNGVVIFGDHTLAVKFVDFNFIVGADGVKILITPDNEVRFLFYVICEAAKHLDIGYTRHYNQLLELYVNIPIDIAEQTAIATILSDMDAEIDGLTAKLNKARQLKQGMMSELLTGRIRLTEVDDNGEN